MQVQNEHLELFDYLENHHGLILLDSERLDLIHLINKSNNSIASVEPEPLAKNKQTENDFHCHVEKVGYMEPKCDKQCEECRLEKS